MAEWINDPQGREEIEKVTKELKLPVWKANHKGKFRDFWNELWDKIEDYILKLKRDIEKNSKSLNDRLVSAVGKHDGDFPIANAVVGNVYYSELTKKYYKCKVGGPAPMPNGNFIDMSILENLNRLENLKRNGEQIMYNGGSPVPVGTSGKLPGYVTFNNILDYYFKIRFFGGVSFYVVLDNSSNTNIVDYTLFNGIKFHLDINTNVLKLVADPNREFISISVFNKLT
nr:MAG TPA: hypothetical protein [Caudoviricetes sp.]